MLLELNINCWNDWSKISTYIEHISYAANILAMLYDFSSKTPYF